MRSDLENWQLLKLSINDNFRLPLCEEGEIFQILKNVEEDDENFVLIKGIVNYPIYYIINNVMNVLIDSLIHCHFVSPILNYSNFFFFSHKIIH